MYTVFNIQMVVFSAHLLSNWGWLSAEVKLSLRVSIATIYRPENEFLSYWLTYWELLISITEVYEMYNLSLILKNLIFEHGVLNWNSAVSITAKQKPSGNHSFTTKGNLTSWSAVDPWQDCLLSELRLAKKTLQNIILVWKACAVSLNWSTIVAANWTLLSKTRQWIVSGEWRTFTLLWI